MFQPDIVQQLVIDRTRKWCDWALDVLTAPWPCEQYVLLSYRDHLVLQTERLVQSLGSDGISHPAFSECQYLITEIDLATGYGH